MVTATKSNEPEIRTQRTKGFADLLTEHQSMVYSIALHFVMDHAAAEEIAQDVFLELYRRLSELESDAHVQYWLRRVTSNRCIDYTRRRKLRPMVPLADVAEPSVSAGQGDPMLRRKLWAVVASLPEAQRLVTVLRYQEGMMPEEIARTLDLRVRTVKSQLTRSLALLREKLGRMGDLR